MDLLCVYLSCDVHADLIQFELKGLNLLSYFLNCVSGGFLFQMLIALADYKVDFLGFLVKLGPAHLYITLICGFD